MPRRSVRMCACPHSLQIALRLVELKDPDSCRIQPVYSGAQADCKLLRMPEQPPCPIPGMTGSVTGTVVGPARGSLLGPEGEGGIQVQHAERRDHAGQKRDGEE